MGDARTATPAKAARLFHALYPHRNFWAITTQDQKKWVDALQKSYK